MNMKKKLIATVLGFSLAVSSFTSIQAKEVNVAEKKTSAIETIMKGAVSINPQSSELAPTETPSTEAKIYIYDQRGKNVSSMTPFHYTKRAQIEKKQFTAYSAVIPQGYSNPAVLPVKVKAKGALVAAAANELGQEMNIYEVYADEACKKHIGVRGDFVYLPKAGTYYIKFNTYQFLRDQDTKIAVVLGFVSGENVELKNKSYAFSSTVGKNAPIYYKVKVTKTSKLTFKVDSEYSSYVTLCNSKKLAITSEEYIFANEGKAVYVVPKGTYYFKVRKSEEVFCVSATYTTVSSAGMTSKSKAGTLKVNGSTRNILILPGDATGKTYYMKFYNPKKQKITLNVTSSYTSGKVQFQFTDAKNSSFGTRTIYNGINKKNAYIPYTYGNGTNSKMLLKGTYYIKMKKLDKKTSGIIQVNIKNR